MTIEIIGHGGAGDFFPGNSRESIEKALEIGVDRIEVDILATVDDDLALVHDAKIRLNAKRAVPVRRLPTELVRAHLDSMLTLDEFFDLIGPAMPVLLDLKRPGHEQLVADAVTKHPGRDVWISTTYARSILALRRSLPDVPFGLSSGHLASGIANPLLRSLTVLGVRALIGVPLVASAKLCGAQMIVANHKACSPFLVRLAHAAGLRVAVWTVNRPVDIERVARLGVDAIISNRPDLVQETLER